MTIDLAGLWDSGLLLFYLSLALVIVLDVAVMLWASGAVSRKGSQAKPSLARRAEPLAAKPQPPAKPQLATKPQLAAKPQRAAEPQPVDEPAAPSPSLPSRVFERRRLENAQSAHLVRVGEVPVGL
jgi:hypothetical protein